jgi:GT2 family glycosyltransferase
LREFARRVHEIYGLPFRPLSPGRHLGYSAANNLAAERAASALLLLLNSDVLPTRARWVGALAKAYRSPSAAACSVADSCSRMARCNMPG